MDAGLADEVLERFGLDSRPEPTLEGLSAVYRGWCHSVPFDNIRKRRWMADGATEPPPGGDADDFFRAFLRHGTGGTCWSTSGALTELVLHLGFDARRAASSMLPFPDVSNRPNHGTTIVRLGDEQWLVDSSMLTEDPLPLLPDAPSVGGTGITSARVEPAGALWRVWWKPWRAGPEEMPCEIEDDDADAALFLSRYKASTEMSPFNAALYVRKGSPDGILIVAGDTLTNVDREGRMHRRSVGEARDEVLVSVFGFSEEVVATIPPDEDGPGPQVPLPR